MLKLKNNPITLLALLVMSVFAGCGDDDNNSIPTGAGTSPINVRTVQEVNCSNTTADTVHIIGNTFSPGTITIPSGGIVKWENQDAVNHTVTGGTPTTADGRFDVLIKPGTEKCLQFNDAGPFAYFCKIHPEMTGTVTVQEEE